MSELAMRVTVIERPPTVLALTTVEPDRSFFAFAVITEDGQSKVAATAYGKTEKDARSRLVTDPYQSAFERRPPAPEPKKRAVRKKT